MEQENPLAQAARFAIERMGGVAQASRLFGVTKAAVQQWKRSGIPAARVGRVAALTGLDAAELRPDLFGPVG
jgi:DNA-binding transcriptional regulator YdaS (Cro superfamily)